MEGAGWDKRHRAIMIGNLYMKNASDSDPIGNFQSTGGVDQGGGTNVPVNFHMKMGVGSSSKGPTGTISEACAVRGEN